MSTPLVRVGDLATQIRGVTYGKSDASKSPSPGNLPVLRAGNITDDGLTFDDLVYVPSERISKKQMIRKHDVVIAASSGSLSVVGKAAASPIDLEGGFGAFCKVLRPSTKVDPTYFAQFFQTPDYRRRISALAAGANINNLRSEHLDELQIPLPPLPEQRRIGEVLDRAEALRAKRRAALTQLDSLTQSIFLDMFGDPAANPKKWPIKSLGEVAREPANNGIFRKNHEYDDAGETGIPVAWVADLFRGDSIDVSASRRLVPTKTEMSKFGLSYGDLLFCRSSLKLDGIAFNSVYLGEAGQALFECHIIRIRPDMNAVSPIYLNRLLRLPQMRAIAKSKSKTATMTTIDQTSLCSIPVIVPPLILQQTFAHRITAIETLKTTHRAALVELDTLFASLQHRAFRGKL